ncbi:MAG: aldo/keto reductase [Actinomycetaceae bacterium]|nr:aldo/keto reductase [Actinomycetaceae bacterium]
MEKRTLGSSGFEASIIGVGTWQLGFDWGDVTEEEAHEVLSTSLESGVTFIDTADVYGDGRSESLVGRFVARHPNEGLVVATKMGRRVEQRPENYTPEAMRTWNDRSRELLGVDTLDLVQLHCPPTEVLNNPATWETLREMVDEGRIRAFGASVETCDQALLAIEGGAASIQIILNILRRKPIEEVLPAAREAGVGIIARVPLASGLLSGKYRADTTFPASDHRTYNRDGSAFDIGETFSGIPFDVGVEAGAEFARLCGEYGPEGATPAQVALAWIAGLEGVTTVIPGARNAEQARANAQAANLPALSEDFQAALADLYDRYARPHVHDRW